MLFCWPHSLESDDIHLTILLLKPGFPGRSLDTFLFFMAKPAFRRIWIIFSPFSKTSSAVLVHTMVSSIYYKCFEASLVGVLDVLLGP